MFQTKTHIREKNVRDWSKQYFSEHCIMVFICPQEQILQDRALA